MKKIIPFLVLSCLMLSFMSTKAQKAPQPISFTATDGVTAKTVSTNTDTAIAIIKLASYNEALTIQAIVNKTSGTIAGKVYLYGSLDATNYDKLDSLTLSDQAVNFKHFTVSPPAKYYAYQLQYVATGTQASTFKALYKASARAY